MLSIRLLGQFDLRLDNAQLALPSRAAQELFAYLLLHPRIAHRREMLAGLFWPTSDEAHARNNLRQALHRLRLLLEKAGRPWLFADEIALRLEPGAECWLDVWTLERKPIPDAVEDLLEIVGVYGGDLLPGFYGDWIGRERERLRALFERRLAQLLDHFVAAGRWTETLEWGERWIALGQTPEPAYRALMQAYLGLGDLAGAVAQYHRCEADLRREINLAPSPPTQRLFEAISRGKATTWPPVPLSAPRGHNLPPCLTSFVGRQKEIQTIHQLLRQGRLVTLTGAAGSGKTRLALHVANEALANYPDGTWLIDLAPLSEAAALISAVAAVFGLNESLGGGRPLPGQLRDYLLEKGILLILDNCERQIAASAALAEALLRDCPGVAILATSREPLGLEGEQLFPTPPLSLPEPGAGLMNSEALRLFMERASAVQPGFALTDENGPVIAHLCQRLDGLPLAIELAAARVNVLTVTEIESRLADRFQLLVGGGRSAPPHHRTLAASLSWSWSLLSAQERVLLRRQAVFVGGWSLDAAERVCGQAPEHGVAAEAALPPKAVMDTLSQLVNKSLVVMEAHGPAARYRLLESILDYAHDRLREAQEIDALRERHLQHYLQLAADITPHLRGSDAAPWFAQLDVEYDNLLAALNWALETESVSRAGEDISPAGDEASFRLVKVLGPYWCRRGRWQEGRRRLEAILQQRGPAASLTQSEAHYYAAVLAYRQNDLLTAQAHLDAGLPLWRQTGANLTLVDALRIYGNICREQGDQSQAGRWLTESLALSRQLGDGVQTAWVLMDQGILAAIEGDPAQARALLESSLALQQAADNAEGIAATLMPLTTLKVQDGDWKEAAALATECLSLARGLQDEALVAYALGFLRFDAINRGDFAVAQDCLFESLRIWQTLGVPSEIAGSLLRLGLWHLSQGDLEPARKLFDDGLTRARRIGMRTLTGYAQYLLGFWHYLNGDFPEAAHWLRDSLASAAGTDGETSVWFLVGRVALAQGDLQAAREALHRCVIVHQPRIRWQSVGTLAASVEALAELETAEGRPGQAVRWFASVDAVRERLDLHRYPVEHSTYEAAVAATRERLGEARFAQVWEEGRCLELPQVVREAVASGAPSTGSWGEASPSLVIWGRYTFASTSPHG